MNYKNIFSISIQEDIKIEALATETKYALISNASISYIKGKSLSKSHTYYHK